MYLFIIKRESLSSMDIMVVRDYVYYWVNYQLIGTKIITISPNTYQAKTNN